MSTGSPPDETVRKEAARKSAKSVQTADERAEAYEAEGLPALAALVRCSGEPDATTGAAATRMEINREQQEQRGVALDVLYDVIFHDGDPMPLAVLLRRHLTPERRAQLTKLLAAPARPGT